MEPTSPAPESIELTVEPDDVGKRLDVLLAERLDRFSRVHLRKLINAAAVLVNGERAKAAYRLRAGQRISVEIQELPSSSPEPEDIPLSILYEDDDIAAIDKPPGMVTHPSKGHWSGTLTSALAFHFQRLSVVGGATRPGIVHRLDRDTSGVIVVAKHDQAHLKLSAQFEARTTYKEYAALVYGAPDRDRDVIEQPIGAHPDHREKMTIRANHSTSRHAESFYEVTERFHCGGGYSAIKVLPKTGRTHQIRLHFAHLGCPVICDRLYSGRSSLSARDLGQDDDSVLLARQALHARVLRVKQPLTGESLEFIAPVPDDIQRVVDLLRSRT